MIPDGKNINDGITTTALLMSSLNSAPDLFVRNSDKDWIDWIVEIIKNTRSYRGIIKRSFTVFSLIGDSGMWIIIYVYPIRSIENNVFPMLKIVISVIVNKLEIRIKIDE